MRLQKPRYYGRSDAGRNLLKFRKFQQQETPILTRQASCSLDDESLFKGGSLFLVRGSLLVFRPGPEWAVRRHHIDTIRHQNDVAPKVRCKASD